MDSKLQRQVLISQYRSFVKMLHDAGMSYDMLSDKDVEALDDVDLAALVRTVRDLARTPH